MIERPDEVNRNRRDIDYVLADPNRAQKVAVEVSSLWRSEDAGKEDAYFAKWFERVRWRVERRVAGTFYVTLPVRVPDGLDPEGFGDDLLGVIQRDASRLTAAAKEGKNIALEVHGISAYVYKAKPEGSGLDYARFYPDLSKFHDRVRMILDEKAPKLKRYKDEGLEAWIVVYNTVWPAMSPLDVQRIVGSLLGPDHAHVDHVGICAGNPPDDPSVSI